MRRHRPENTLEIEKSIERGNKLIGVRINHLKDKSGNADIPGAIPAKLQEAGAPIITFTSADDLGREIEKLFE